MLATAAFQATAPGRQPVPAGRRPHRPRCSAPARAPTSEAHAAAAHHLTCVPPMVPSWRRAQQAGLPGRGGGLRVTAPPDPGMSPRAAGRRRGGRGRAERPAAGPRGPGCCGAAARGPGSSDAAAARAGRHRLPSQAAGTGGRAAGGMPGARASQPISARDALRGSRSAAGRGTPASQRLPRPRRPRPARPPRLGPRRSPAGAQRGGAGPEGGRSPGGRRGWSWPQEPRSLRAAFFTLSPPFVDAEDPLLGGHSSQTQGEAALRSWKHQAGRVSLEEGRRESDTEGSFQS